MATLLLFRRRGFNDLATACRDGWRGEVCETREPDDAAGEPLLVLILRDHPDAFRGVADRCRRRWPLAEVLIVDSEWGLSVRRTRPDEPAGWTVGEAEALDRVRRVAAGQDAATPHPWTLTYGERAAANPTAADGWPHVDPPVPR